VFSQIAATALGDANDTGLQALCTEASLRALRRHYPQIYETDDKLLIDPQKVSVTRHDFLAAAVGITPASHRSAAAHARLDFSPLNSTILYLLS
jgi:ATPase family AAA domain-containing protein 2